LERIIVILNSLLSMIDPLVNIPNEGGQLIVSQA
jgi:hypothetical protein